jgi:hypothetical protein
LLTQRISHNSVIHELQGPTKRHDWLAEYEWGNIDVSNQPKEANFDKLF